MYNKMLVNSWINALLPGGLHEVHYLITKMRLKEVWKKCFFVLVVLGLVLFEFVRLIWGGPLNCRYMSELLRGFWDFVKKIEVSTSKLGNSLPQCSKFRSRLFQHSPFSKIRWIFFVAPSTQGMRQITRWCCRRRFKFIKTLITLAYTFGLQDLMTFYV